MWHLSSPTRVRTISPALKGGFVMAGPPGTSRGWLCTCLRKKENHLRMLTWTVAAGGAGEGFSSVQFSHSVMSDSLRPHGLQHARPPCLSPTPGAYSKHVHWAGYAIQPSHPLHALLLLPSIFPSIRVFSKESVLHIRWPKYWSFSFIISPSNEYSGLISFRMDLVGSPCSPRDSQESSPTPQFKSIHSSVLSFHYGPALNPYMTAGKTIALTRWTFASKVMFLLF